MRRCKKEENTKKSPVKKTGNRKGRAWEAGGKLAEKRVESSLAVKGRKKRKGSKRSYFGRKQGGIAKGTRMEIGALRENGGQPL